MRQHSKDWILNIVRFTRNVLPLRVLIRVFNTQILYKGGMCDVINEKKKKKKIIWGIGK